MNKCRMMSKEEWLSKKQRGIGGSDLGPLMGLSRWKSRHQLWLEKTGQLDKTEEKEISFARKWGQRIEDNIAREFSEQTGLKVKRCNFILIHPEYDYMIANIDRRGIDEKGNHFILECTSTYSFNKDWSEEEIPAEKELQLLHYLMITGVEYGYIACVLGNSKLIIKKVVLEKEVEELLLREEQEFWDYVMLKKMPPADGSESFSKTLSELYPRALKYTQAKTLSEVTYQRLYKRKELLCQAEIFKNQINLIENQVKEEMKDSEMGISGAFTVTWKNINQQRFDVSRFKDEFPEMYVKYLQNIEYRKFEIKSS